MPDPWTPEDGDALVAPPVTFYAIESAPMKIWHEWLTGWFNGEEHTLCTVEGVEQSVVFPEVQNIAIQNAIVGQELGGLGFGIIQVAQPTVMHRVVTRATRNIQLRLQWRFYIRAKVATRAVAGENSESLCRKASELLYALILLEENHRPLVSKGFHNIRANPAQLLPSQPMWATRTMMVSATVFAGSQSSPS